MKSVSITHQMAVQRLREAGADQVADRVAAFRNVDGGLGGWDGFVRGNFSQRIVAIVWPEERHGLSKHPVPAIGSGRRHDPKASAAGRVTLFASKSRVGGPGASLTSA